MNFKELEVYRRRVPARSAQYMPFPQGLHPLLCEYLQKSGIGLLYTHQAEMFELAEKGKHMVITTSTASGKTLSFLLPVLNRILQDPTARAIFIYPTKALAADQMRALEPMLEFLGKSRVSAGVYDGDTPAAERSRIRRSANIILTNPEMLNGSFLPNHSSYGFDFILTNLKYVVIDELHTYRGAFGAHLANLLRRLTRLCGYYHSSPQYLCSSATIANPVELAQIICGKPFVRVEQDGSPAVAKEYVFLQPPAIEGKDGKTYGRESAVATAASLIPALAGQNRHFIAFAKSRRNVEIVLKESRDRLEAAGFLEEGLAKRIAGYRGGYTPKERREIEEKMITGQLSGLVSTNALELGIDIGSLDTTVLVGYPGTRASFWQQTGRAGRKAVSNEEVQTDTDNSAGSGGCVNYLILENAPFDQYVALDPDWLLEKESEYAIVDRDNLQIQLSHIRAAAAEMPLTLDDIALFPDLGEILAVLLEVSEVRDVQGRFAWSGSAFPAGDFSLRNIDQSRFKLLDAVSGRSITEMDEMQAYREMHPGAIYLHEGILYEVTKLDIVSRTGEAVPFNGNFYTVPAGSQDIDILQMLLEKKLGRVEVRFGDIHVEETISMYKKLQFHNHQNLGNVQLGQPLSKEYDTEGVWISIPSDVAGVYRGLLQRFSEGELVLNNHFEGMCSALKNAAMMVTMTERDDIDVTISNNALIPDENEEQVVSLYIYDKYEGGLGYSEKIYDLVPQIVDNAIRMVKGCVCESGCPACVGDYNLDKKMVLWGLENLKEQTEAPEYCRKNVEKPQTAIQKEFSFLKLSEQWEALCESIIHNGEKGGAFLKTVKEVTVEGHRLILTVENGFYGIWMMEKENMRSIENTIRYHAVCPADMKVEVRVEEDKEKSKKIEEKLKRKTGK